MKMEPIERSETSASNTQTPGNYPKETVLHFLKRLTGFQLVKKFLEFYGTEKFITAFTSARLTENTYDNMYTVVKHFFVVLLWPA
jgi:hypothetical protein